MPHAEITTISRMGNRKDYCDGIREGKNARLQTPQAQSSTVRRVAVMSS